MNTNNKATLIFLSLFVTGVLLLPLLSSCGKTGVVNGTGSNTQIEVLNLSPDVGPIDLYANYIKQDASSYIFNTGGTYFYISPNDTPYQIRTALAPSVSIISTDNFNMASNHKYSLFITGEAFNSTIAGIFTADDTTAVPQVGYGKLRFVNASIQAQNNPSLDVTANGTVAFSAIKYEGVSPYIQLPAGNYNFLINVTGTPNTVFSTPSTQNVTIQDGRLYTLYAYGIVGQTDTAAFNAAIITNK
jgi:hypothetical protein